MAAILNFRIFRKNCKTQKCFYILKSVLDRADYANFGCHNSLRLEAQHILNTLPLTFISFLSFSGRFVFAVQKHYLFFASDPLLTPQPLRAVGVLLEGVGVQRHGLTLI